MVVNPKGISGGHGRKAVVRGSQAVRAQVVSLYQATRLPRYYTRLKLWILAVESAAYLPRHGKILDVGCGYGLLANYLSLDSAARDVIGYDVAPDRISLAQQTVGERRNIAFAVGRAQDFQDGEFDGIVVTDVLHHLPYQDQPLLLADLHAKLKPGGVLVVRETDKKFRLRYFLCNYLLEWLCYLGAEKLRFRAAGEWSGLLESAGFAVQQILPNPPWFPYITATFICRKGLSAPPV